MHPFAQHPYTRGSCQVQHAWATAEARHGQCNQESDKWHLAKRAPCREIMCSGSKIIQGLSRSKAVARNADGEAMRMASRRNVACPGLNCRSGLAHRCGDDYSDAYRKSSPPTTAYCSRRHTVHTTAPQILYPIPAPGIVVRAVHGRRGARSGAPPGPPARGRLVAPFPLIWLRPPPPKCEVQ